MSSPRSILVALALLLTSTLWVGQVQAQVIWDGDGDGSSWSDPANWNPDGVPGSDDDVRISGTARVEISEAISGRKLDRNGSANPRVFSNEASVSIEGPDDRDGLSYPYSRGDGGPLFGSSLVVGFRPQPTALPVELAHLDATAVDATLVLS